MEDLVGAIFDSNTLQVLLKLSQNPLQSTDEKYGKLNLQNKKIQGWCYHIIGLLTAQDLWSNEAARTVMLVVGWVESEDGHSLVLVRDEVALRELCDALQQRIS